MTLKKIWSQRLAILVLVSMAFSAPVAMADGDQSQRTWGECCMRVALKTGVIACQAVQLASVCVGTLAGMVTAGNLTMSNVAAVGQIVQMSYALNATSVEEKNADPFGAIDRAIDPNLSQMYSHYGNAALSSGLVTVGAFGVTAVSTLAEKKLQEKINQIDSRRQSKSATHVE